MASNPWSRVRIYSGLKFSERDCRQHRFFMGFAYQSSFCRRKYFLIDWKGHLSGLGQHGGFDSQVALYVLASTPITHFREASNFLLADFVISELSMTITA